MTESSCNVPRSDQAIQSNSQSSATTTFTRVWSKTPCHTAKFPADDRGRRLLPFNAKAGGFADNPDASEHFLKLHEIMSKDVGIPEDGSEYIVGPWLSFDSDSECCIGDHAEEANALLKDDNRAGFKVPKAADV